MRPLAACLFSLTFTVSASLAAGDSPEILSLRDKAMHGNAIAQYNLGIALAQGYGTPVDLPGAYAWLELASEQGTAGKALENLLATLSVGQLAAGQGRLEDIRAQLASSRPVNLTSASPRSVAPQFSKSTANPTPAPTPTAKPGALTSAERRMAKSSNVEKTATGGDTAPNGDPSSSSELSELRAQVAALNASIIKLQADMARLQANSQNNVVPNSAPR